MIEGALIRRIVVVGGGAGGIEMTLAISAPFPQRTSRRGTPGGRGQLSPAHCRRGDPEHSQSVGASRFRARPGHARALGDIFAMGAEPQSAAAIALLPSGLSGKIEADLGQMMSGAVEVLNEASCALVGGHSGEGRVVWPGFAVNGLVDEGPGSVMGKVGMRPGDMPLLTKALGTGVLFAAHARLAARGRWIDEALTSIILSNRVGARHLRTHGATACTDVTGFGLLGHLLEMTHASGVHAELDLEVLPMLKGVEAVLARGIVSSLHSPMPDKASMCEIGARPRAIRATP